MESAECVGGLLDGATVEIVAGAPEALVTMADGTRHRCARRRPSAPPVSEWRGRV